MLEGRLVVVVVPAFNEAAHIEAVITTMPPIVDRVIVVDDASHDATARVAARARPSTGAAVEVVRHRENEGVGAAIVTGYRRALDRTAHPRDAIAVMAGDGQMVPGELEALVSPVVRGHAGYAKGDRFAAKGTRTTMPFARYAGGQVLSRLTSWALATPIHDSQCGFTVIAREALASLDLAALWPRYGYPNDLLAQLSLRGHRIVERPVSAVYAGQASGIGARHVPQIAWLIARAWLRRGRLSPQRGRGLARALRRPKR